MEGRSGTQNIFIHFKPCHAEYFYVLNIFFSVNLQNSSCKHVFSIRIESSVGPD